MWSNHPRAIVTGSIVVSAFLTVAGYAQIGGKTSADGPFLLDDAEAGDLIAVGVERNWIPDYNGLEPALKPVDPVEEGLTLASGQSPQGALHFNPISLWGYIDMSFGVPMPAVKGASTDPDDEDPNSGPGDITSFTHMTFLACYSPSPGGEEFQVILECYPRNPDETFPKIVWLFEPAEGTTFEPVTINLRQPDLIRDGGDNTLEELLSQTRYLALYVFAGPYFTVTEIDIYVDDITLQDHTTGLQDMWLIYE